MNNLDKQYIDLVDNILRFGTDKTGRNGKTKSKFGYTIRHDMKNGFPLLTTKKVAWERVVTELLWFLRGDTNIKYLVENNCHIWDGDTYKNYKTYMNKNITETRWCKTEIIGNSMVGRHYTQEEFINKIKTDDEFAKKWGELGPIYGKQWRRWKKQTTNSIIENPYKVGNTNIPGKEIVNFEYIDQIANLINNIKIDPDSRRLMVNAWNVGELDEMVLPPCHYGFQVYTRELSIDERNSIFSERTFISTKGSFAEQNGTLDDYFNKEGIPRRAISLLWNQRSVDVPLGLPFNIASYGLLLHILAEITNMVPDELIGNLGDCHIYENQIEGIEEQMGRELSVEERRKIMESKGIDFTDINMFFNNTLDTPKYEMYEKIIPTRTRQPYPLPSLRINTEFWPTESGECGIGPLTPNINHLINEMQVDDFQIENYKSHPAIKMPLSN